MKTDAPPLLPIFRSDGQARLLAYLYLRPEEATTLSALARELDLSHTTLSREADKLERAGLIRSERIGNQRRLRRNEESVYFPALRDLLLRAFGPVPLLERTLREVDGVERAFLYGSWAARYLGEPGEAPNDLDLLVVGSPQRSALARIGRDLERQLGYEVNPTVVPPEEWQAKKSGFLRSVARGPLVELRLAE
jgi:DNA-binding transcriptional ArsR family regulator